MASADTPLNPPEFTHARFSLVLIHGLGNLAQTDGLRIAEHSSDLLPDLRGLFWHPEIRKSVPETWRMELEFLRARGVVGQRLGANRSHRCIRDDLGSTE